MDLIILILVILLENFILPALIIFYTYTAPYFVPILGPVVLFAFNSPVITGIGKTIVWLCSFPVKFVSLCLWILFGLWTFFWTFLCSVGAIVNMFLKLIITLVGFASKIVWWFGIVLRVGGQLIVAVATFFYNLFTNPWPPEFTLWKLIGYPLKRTYRMGETSILYLQQWHEYFPTMIYLLDIFMLIFLIWLIFNRLICNNNKRVAAYNLTKITIKGLFFYLVFSLIIAIVISGIEIHITEFVYYDETFVMNAAILYMRIFICAVTLLILTALLNSIKYEKITMVDYPLLILFNIISIFGLFSSNNYFMLFLWLEMQSFSLYLLAALGRGNLAKEASLKYFLYGSFLSSMLLLGLSLIYWNLGTLNYEDCQLLWSYLPEGDWITLKIGMCLLFAGLMFKLGLVPFHSWVADVYAGAPLIIVYFFTTVTKLPLFFVLFRAFNIIFNPLVNASASVSMLSICSLLTNLFILCAVLSILIGTFGAYYETGIKRLLAYSSILNGGFILLAMSLGTYGGVMAAVYHLVIYIWSVSQLVFILNTLRKPHTFMNVNALTEFSIISYSLILIGLSLTSAILSLAGIPPFAGFFGKFMIMQSLLEVSYYLLTLSSLVMTVAIPTYYIRIIRFILFRDSGKKEPIQSFLPISFSHHVMIITMFIMNIGFLFYQPKFLYLIQVVCDYLLLTC